MLQGYAKKGPPLLYGACMHTDDYMHVKHSSGKAASLRGMGALATPCFHLIVVGPDAAMI